MYCCRPFLTPPPRLCTAWPTLLVSVCATCLCDARVRLLHAVRLLKRFGS